ncbi:MULTISPECIES: mechanosensitive ion channel family protein [Staphylococcus]|uniref:Mechanosensitive ion channel n=2 Tax=Staphylococcus TaxID=1279 RepID=A0ABN5WCZ3_9STAP|nr:MULTISPECIES: mechanosensitive ion channel family protein [Staphylococcus]EES41304.1 transporter, small conductance mechanosensitive ion channel MscS family protein [Staphylococcus caprae M23864:W1]MBN6826664.1 mechanosensitive ion channel family protein [Staphylococcus caprae]MBU5272703.1 mechanosensitive ion channel family protein [Staphylococcus caprae]MBX5317296.1 mechanosensitive ion channel family protein [Staphylococcus caprae]MBX5323719.1 mechanosensitive ion channel family protein 
MNQIKHILSSLFEPLTKIETYENLVSKIIMILIYIIVALIVIAILNKVIEQAFKIQNKSKKGSKKRSKTLISLVQNVVKYIVWFIVLTTILSKFGISVEGVIASAGVVGVAVGFGAQTIVKDIITGFFIIFENQFDVGDYVKINSGGTTVAEGTVKSIGLRSTRINTISGELTILPNGSMGEITNFSITNGTSIVQLPVSVDENLDQVEKKLNKLFTSLRSKYYLFVSDPVVDGIDAIENNKAIIRVSAETIPGEGASGARIIRKEAQRMFVQEGIRMPQPLFTQYDEAQSKD